MKLVIVESPTKARTLSRYLGSGYQVEASMGHVRDLPKSKLGVDVDKGFAVEYVIAKDKSAVVKKLQTGARRAESVYLAMDPDREGEAIAWHVAHLLTDKKTAKPKQVGGGVNFKRVTFHEITKEAILEAMAKPGKLNNDLVDAQQTRRVVDRLVGYTLSPVLWKKVRRGLSAGRVQSVALRLIVEREREIEAFVPVGYWAIAVQVKKSASDSKQPAFWTELVSIDGVKAKKNEFLITDTAVAKSVAGDLPKAVYVVDEVKRREQKRRPYPPFTTSTMQQAAANSLGWTAKRTMQAAQRLYEQGKITYHRTDSLNLSAKAVAAARKMIEADYGSAYVPDKPRFYKTKSKSAQEAHEAIRPTKIADRGVGSDSAESKLYRLIWKRFMACQMTEAVYDATTIDIKGTRNKAQGTKQYGLRATGSIMKFDGWKAVYGGLPGTIPGSAAGGTRSRDHSNKMGKEDVVLPEVVEGEQLKYQDLNSEQKFTQPPPRYNDASLVKALEERGIGRPSTYAPIISTIMARGYVERKERRFYPSAVGMTVTDFLVDHFTTVMDYDFTAQMENDLDLIAQGEKEWVPVVEAFWGPFAKKVKMVEEKGKRVQIPVETTGKKCPECKKGEVVIRTGRYGKFYSCSTFPDCRYTDQIVETVPGVVCPLCQEGKVVVKNTRWGRPFHGCQRYPDCDWASWKKPEKGERITKKAWAEQQKARAERKKKREATMRAKKKGAGKSKKK